MSCTEAVLQQFAHFMVEHWKELKDVPDAPLSLYEVCHHMTVLFAACLFRTEMTGYSSQLDKGWLSTHHEPIPCF